MVKKSRVGYRTDPALHGAGLPYKRSTIFFSQSIPSEPMEEELYAGFLLGLFHRTLTCKLYPNFHKMISEDANAWDGNPVHLAEES
jgi:hypothetical protein